jgi:hypothetical protein
MGVPEMANEEHLAILRQGVQAWNRWRDRHAEIRPDLRGMNLEGASLRRVDFRKSDLSWANLARADLDQARFWAANLSWANLSDARLRHADLWGTDLSGTIFVGADMEGSDLTHAHLVEANLERSNLTNCRVYGASVWNLKLDGAVQSDIVITRPEDATITVDDIEVAQFIYLLLNNEMIRRVIETITSKAVLILGRFTDERKAVLDALRDALRRHDYLPILFDFEKPASRDLTETISTLAHMARFVIADITDAQSIPQELQAIVPQLPSVPVQPLLLASQREYGMFEHFKRYPWVLPVYEYDALDGLLASLEERVIAPAEAKAGELAPR